MLTGLGADEVGSLTEYLVRVENDIRLNVHSPLSVGIVDRLLELLDVWTKQLQFLSEIGASVGGELLGQGPELVERAMDYRPIAKAYFEPRAKRKREAKGMAAVVADLEAISGPSKALKSAILEYLQAVIAALKALLETDGGESQAQ